MRKVGPLARQLRESPIKRLGGESLVVLRHGGELQRRKQALAT